MKIKLKSSIITSPAVKRRYPKQDKTRRLGEKAPHDVLHNCLSCARSPSCKDTNKSLFYRCTRFREATLEATTIEELFKNPQPDDEPEEILTDADLEYDKNDEESIFDMISKVINSNAPVPPDFRINDKEIPTAKNFQEWVYGYNFGLARGGQKPFPRQVEIGTKLFAEYCPRCSDVDWFDEMPVDAARGEIEDRVVFLENGICPECSATRSEMIVNGELNNYYGVVGLAGQRCVTGDTLIMTTQGFKYIEDMVHPAYTQGFNEFRQPTTSREGKYSALEVSLENGHTTKPSDFYISNPSHTYKIVTREGYEVEGTADHPIMVERGWIKLGKIQEDDNVLIQGGQNVWSASNKITVDEAKLLGFIVAEGHKATTAAGTPNRLSISNKNSRVLDFCAQILESKNVEVKHIKQKDRIPEIRVDGVANIKPLLSLIENFQERSRDVCIPKQVLESKVEVVKAFLSTLYEGDGWVDMNGDIQYLSTSNKLIKELQIILLNFGIYSSRYSRMYSATNGKEDNETLGHLLTISGQESRDLFMREIGFFTTERSKNLRKNFQHSVPFKTDKLTASQQQKILYFFTEIEYELSVYSKKRSSMSLRSMGIRLDRLKKAQFGLTRLNAIKSCNLILDRASNYLSIEKYAGIHALLKELAERKYYSPVVSITKSEEKKVTYDFEIPVFHKFMANGILNHNSAKTTSAILWDTYDLHKTLKIPNPQAAFNMLSSTPITSTFAATTFAQAVDNVWTPYLSTVKSDAPWFDNYHKFLDRKGEELGEELYSVGEHMIRYRHRNIVLTPSGPNKRTMRGKSRRSGLVDEIGWFKLAKKSGKVGEELELMDAKGVFDALNNSLLTLKQGHTRRLEEGYNDLPKPVMYLVSSPSAYNDFIMTAYRMYQQSTEMYAFKYATWEYNPLYKKTDKIFSEGFRLKPVETARDYECNPPIGEGLFINSEAPIKRAMKSGPNKISVTARKGLSKAKVSVTNSSLRLLSNSLPSVGTILCIDVGLVNNSLAFSIVGPKEDYSPDDPMEDVGSIQTPAQVYAVGEIIPYADTKINLTSVYQDCFVPLLDPFDIRYMVSDRWNNAKIASDLDETYGVIPLEHKCRWGDFEATRDLLYSGNLILPKRLNPLKKL